MMKLNPLSYYSKTDHIKNVKKIILLPFFTLFINCEEQQRNCKDFYTGTFYSETIVDGNKYKSNFKRNNTNIQIEQFEGVIDSSTVRWVNDCEMVLSSINPKNRNEKKNILIKILSTTDSSYTYEYSYVGENIKLKAKAFKIK